MDKYQQAIIKYEAARLSLVNGRTAVGDLLRQCEYLPDYEDITLDYDPCLKRANEGLSAYNRSVGYDERMRLDDWVLNCAVEEGLMCETCRDAWELHRGKNAQLRAEFGIAKRGYNFSPH